MLVAARSHSPAEVMSRLIAARKRTGLIGKVGAMLGLTGFAWPVGFTVPRESPKFIGDGPPVTTIRTMPAKLFWPKLGFAYEFLHRLACAFLARRLRICCITRRFRRFLQGLQYVSTTPPDETCTGRLWQREQKRSEQ